MKVLITMPVCCSHGACALPMTHVAWRWGDADVRQLYLLPAGCAPQSSLQEHAMQFAPPDYLMLSASALEANRLPPACQEQLRAVPAAQRMHSALRDVAAPQAYKRSCTGAAGHKCVVETSSRQRNAARTFEVHFAHVPTGVAALPRAANTSLHDAGSAQGVHSAWAAAAASEWQQPLQRIAGSEAVQLQPRGSRLLVRCPASKVLALAQVLASQPHVALVTPARQHSLHSLAAAASVVQGGSSHDDMGTAHALWDAGLTGKGQTIGMGDSGLDMEHCAYR